MGTNAIGLRERGTSERVHRYNRISLFPETCGSSWLARPAAWFLERASSTCFLAPPSSAAGIAIKIVLYDGTDEFGVMFFSLLASPTSLDFGRREPRENNPGEMERKFLSYLLLHGPLFRLREYSTSALDFFVITNNNFKQFSLEGVC